MTNPITVQAPKRIIVFTEPSEAQYLNVKTFQPNEKIDTPGLPEPLAVRELLIQ